MASECTKRLSFSGLFFCLILNTLVAQAENGSSNGKQDESSHRIQLKPMVVTAQKRAEAPIDVPVSMTVVSGEQLDEYNINRLDDPSSFVPGLSITQAATTTRIFLRGVGSGVNQGFEQSVGTFVDDIYYARPRQLRLPLFDIEQVEVLRGPQGTIFGKNTVAGAINIRTREPSDFFYSDVSALHEIEHNEYRVGGIVSGPLTDTLKGRLSVRAGGMGGFLRNSFNGSDEPREDYYTARGKFHWLPSANLEVSGKYEYNELDVDGRSIQIIEAGPSLPLFTLFDPLFEDRLNEIKSTGGIGNERSKTDSNLGMLRMEYALADFSLVSLSDFTDYDYNEDRDVDFSPIPLLLQREKQGFSQFSQEIRLLSPETTSFKYLVGAYYQEEHLDNLRFIDANFTPTPFLPFPNTTRQIEFDQDTWTAAFFGRGSYDITDDLILSVGLRYSYEEKKATKSLAFNDFRTTRQNPVLAGSLRLFGVPHRFKNKITDSSFCPSASLQYYLLERSMVYATYAEGNKPGGFNEAETFGDPDNFKFESEHSRSFEIGNKNIFLNGDAHFNLNLFYTQYKDFQVSAFDGLDFIVGNADESIAKGVEFEMGWQITEGLALSGNVNWLDSKYDSFPNGSCTIAQRQAMGLLSRCVQDLSGKTTQFAPDYSGTVSLDYWRQIPGNMALAARIDMPFTDGFYVAQDLDPEAFQSGFIKLSARLALSSADGQWEIAVIGRNLTNKLTISHGDDVALLSGSHFGVTERPRTIAFEAIARFE